MAKYKNIIGVDLLPYVQDQITTREKIVNKNKRTPSDLQWLTNRTGWFRLSSGVNTQDGDNYTAKQAQLNVLQGGTIAAGGDKTALKRGFEETYTRGNEDNLGYKPMPGITGVRIGTGGRWQTLLEANIEFVCYNLDQLDTMTKLYMSLGATVFLEWGHTPYVDNNGKLINDIRPINFFPFSNEDELLQEVNKRRKSTYGNYDAVVGKVLNFNWKPNTDGSYNCETTIIGAGGIVESLRINSSINVDFNKGKNIESEKYSSILGNTLWSMHYCLANQGATFKLVKDENGVITKFGKIGPESFFQTPNENISSWGDLLKQIYNSATYNRIDFEEGDDFGAHVRYINQDESDPIKNFSAYGNAYQLISGIAEGNDDLDEIPTDFYSGYVNILKTDNGKKNIASYITLGHLMALIQHIGVFAQSNEGINISTSSPNTDTCTPIMYIDYHPDNTEVLTGPLECSIDPTVCIIPWKNNAPISDIFAPLDVESASQYKWWGGLDKRGNKEKNFVINSNKNKVNKVAPNYGGKIFNILVNIEFAYKTLEKLSKNTPNRDVNLIEYVDVILDNINNSLGQVNKLRSFIGEEGKVLRIIDEQLVQEIPSDNFCTIPIFGKKSTVYDYGFSTRITPNTMAQIVIATQAVFEDGLKNFPDDALSFAALNYDIEDRFSRVKFPAVLNKTNSIETDIAGIQIKTYQKLYDHIYYCYATDNDDNIGLKLEEISNLITTFSDLQGINQNTLPGSKGNILLPIEYSLTLDGISGILPYNAFKIPDNRLPKKYKGRIAFVVFSINHNLDDNRWTTTLRGQAIPLDKPSQTFDRKTLKPTGDPVEPPTPTSIDTDFPEVERTPPTVNIGTTEVPDNSFTPNELPDAPVNQPIILQPQTQPIPDPDITAAVNFIKPREGFRSEPYPDPDWNSPRIGYGSDTITRPDGSFYKITRKSRVDKESAERDLIRRVKDEFKPRVVNRLNSRSVDYSTLPLKLQVVFIDLAYNYGTLFYDFIEAYKANGVQGVIDELQRRANLGGSQVPSRRKAEIAYLGG